MHNKRQASAKDSVVQFLTAQGVFFSGVALAAVSVSTVLIGWVLAAAGGALVLRDLYTSISYAYYLEDQTPNQATLLKQLKRKNHIVVAHFKQGNDVKSFVVACKDPSRFDAFIKAGKGMPLEKALALDTEKSICFTGGPAK